MRKINKKLFLITGSLMTLLFSYVLSKDSDLLKITNFTTTVVNADTVSVTGSDTTGSSTDSGSSDSACSCDGDGSDGSDGDGDGDGDGF